MNVRKPSWASDLFKRLPKIRQAVVRSLRFDLTSRAEARVLVVFHSIPFPCFKTHLPLGLEVAQSCPHSRVEMEKEEAEAENVTSVLQRTSEALGAWASRQRTRIQVALGDLQTDRYGDAEKQLRQKAFTRRWKKRTMMITPARWF